MESGELIEMTITGVEEGKVQDGYQEITIATSRGDVECRYYRVEGAHLGAIWVGGVGGDFDTPEKQLYPRMCEELVGEGITSLRLRYRHPTILEEASLDVLAGLTYLEGDGVDAAALIGYSFGGAVVIQAAAADEQVRTVVTLATQSYGAALVSQLAPRCSILLIHGTADETLLPTSSQYVYNLAHEPKDLILYEGARHNLDEKGEEIRQVVRDWIVVKLKHPGS